MSDLEFDANTTEPATGFELLPDGPQTAIIEESEKKPTKKGDGTYLQFTFQIIEGPFKGRKLWSRLNFTNPNETAQKIGRAELSALCRAVGVMTPKKTEELHNKPLRIVVGSEKRSDNGKMSNIIEKYEALQGNIQNAVVDGSSKPAAQATANKAPWAK